MSNPEFDNPFARPRSQDTGERPEPAAWKRVTLGLRLWMVQQGLTLLQDAVLAGVSQQIKTTGQANDTGLWLYAAISWLMILVRIAGSFLLLAVPRRHSMRGLATAVFAFSIAAPVADISVSAIVHASSTTVPITVPLNLARAASLLHQAFSIATLLLLVRMSEDLRQRNLTPALKTATAATFALFAIAYSGALTGHLWVGTILQWGHRALIVFEIVAVYRLIGATLSESERHAAHASHSD